MSTLTLESSSKSGYARFLYAPVYEQKNGMELSVLSALTRMNIDPWTEAARLTAMPRAEAEEALLATLAGHCEEDLTPPETKAAAKRLVDLLQSEEAEGLSASAVAEKPNAERRAFLLLWLGFVLGMMIFSSDSRVRTTDAGVSAPASESISTLRNDIALRPKAD